MIGAAACALGALALGAPAVGAAPAERMSARVKILFAGPVLDGGGVAWSELGRDQTARLRLSRPGEGRPRPRTLVRLRNRDWERRQRWVSQMAGSRSMLAFLVEVRKYDAVPPPIGSGSFASSSSSWFARAATSYNPYRLIAQRLMVGPPRGPFRRVAAFSAGTVRGECESGVRRLGSLAVSGLTLAFTDVVSRCDRQGRTRWRERVVLKSPGRAERVVAARRDAGSVAGGVSLARRRLAWAPRFLTQDEIWTYSVAGRRLSAVGVPAGLASFDIQADGKLAFANNDSRVFVAFPRRPSPRLLHAGPPTAQVRLAANRVVFSEPTTDQETNCRVMLSDLRGRRRDLGGCAEDDHPDWDGRAATWYDGRIMYRRLH
jgi:hypothetical protein